MTGSAEFAIPFIPDDDVRSFTFDAHAVPYSRPRPPAPSGLPTDARGTVKVSHRSPEQNLTVWWEAEVDCLVTDQGRVHRSARRPAAAALSRHIAGGGLVWLSDRWRRLPCACW